MQYFWWCMVWCTENSRSTSSQRVTVELEETLFPLRVTHAQLSINQALLFYSRWDHLFAFGNNSHAADMCEKKEHTNKPLYTSVCVSIYGDN